MAPQERASLSTAVAQVLTATATAVESKQRHGPYQSGPDTYVELHRAHVELFGQPAIRALESALGLRQLQFWKAASPEEVADAIRTVVAEMSDPETDDALALADLHAARITGLRDELAEAIWGPGYEAPDNYEIGHFVDEIRDLSRALSRVLRLAEADRSVTAADLKRALGRASLIVQPAEEVPV